MNTIDEMLKIEHDLETYGLLWANYEAEYKRLDELTKTVLSEIMLEFKGEPVNMREARARADQRFKNHIEGLCEARRHANQNRVKYDTAQARIEIRRSINAVNRAAMGIR